MVGADPPNRNTEDSLFAARKSIVASSRPQHTVDTPTTGLVIAAEPSPVPRPDAAFIHAERDIVRSFRAA